MLYVIDNISNIIDSYNLLIAILIRVSYKKKKQKSKNPRVLNLNIFVLDVPLCFYLSSC